LVALGEAFSEYWKRGTWWIAVNAMQSAADGMAYVKKYLKR
jgi:hypothetical protein